MPQNPQPHSSDPHDLARFTRAQASSYDTALAEIESGRKRSHWMWYVFPQIAGLGSSPTAREFAVKSADEARAYLSHPVLGARLIACAEAALRVENKSARDIFGQPDDLKLRSSATLFAHVSAASSPFHRLLDRFFDGRPDQKTLDLLGAPSTR